MKANTALRVTPPREPAMRVLDPADRRMSIRWRPPTSTKAEMTTSQVAWGGRVLNLSQDGAEISGRPPAVWDSGCEISIRIKFQEYAVAWAASLHRIKKNSHVVVFANSPLLREEQYQCSQCGDPILTFRNRSRALGTLLVCTLCDTPEAQLTVSRRGDSR